MRARADAPLARSRPIDIVRVESAVNEAPLPTQDTLRGSLPPPSPVAIATARATPLRASLRACTTEGLFAEVVGACFGNAVIAAWAVHLGVSAVLMGALWGLPHFGQILQLPASWVTSRFGRRRVTILAHGLARQITLPIAALPFLPLDTETKRAVLVALFGAASLLAVLGHNAWLAWMGELVPARVRGAYFGRRSAICAVVATFASLAVASALDVGRHEGTLGAVLAAIMVVRSTAGIVTTSAMLRQHDPAGASAIPKLGHLRLPFEDDAYAKLLAYRAAWGVATGLTASVSALYMLRTLNLGFFGLSAFTALVTALRVVTTPTWGRALDRLGARPVLVACSFGLASSSFVWLGASEGRAWVLLVDAVASGLLVGGQELAVFTLPLSAAPSEHRPLFAAVNVMVGGVAFGLASVAGGALAGAFALPALLAVSSVLRVGAAGLALRLYEPPRTISPRRRA